MNLRSFYSYRNIIIILCVVFIAFGIYLRFQDLGYSNLQGDEINTLDYLKIKNVNLGDYLFSQKKGPVQFVINYINTTTFGYINEFQVRLPYFLFGVGTLLVWYLFSRGIFDKRTALITTVLVAMHGLFISFSRITQYQTVMSFTLPLVIFSLYKTLKTGRYYWSITTGVLLAFLVLTHYDGLSILFFIIPGLSVVIRNAIKNNGKPELKRLFVSSAIFLLTFVILSASYYVPYTLLNSHFGDSTQGYLSARLLGGGFMPKTQISLDLISMYFPRVGLIVLFLLSILGIYFSQLKQWTYKTKYHGFLTILLTALCGLLIFAATFSFFPFKPRTASYIFIVSSLMLVLCMCLFSQVSWKKVGLISWYLLSFSFYFFVVRDPRTHVYIALLPGLVLSAYALIQIYDISTKYNKILKYLFAVLFLSGMVYLSGLYCAMYVNKSPEYPWWDKTYLGQSIYKISKNNRIDGVFGFNSYRGWDKIGDLYSRGCLKGTFESNEKDNLTYFYIGLNQLNGDKWIDENGADTMVVVEGPQSWTYVKKREFAGYKLLNTIYSNDIPVTYIYGKYYMYPEGKLLCN